MHKINFKTWEFFNKQCTKYIAWHKNTKINNSFIHKTRKSWFHFCSETEFKLMKKVFPAQIMRENVRSH